MSHSLGLPHQPRSFWRVHLFLLRARLPLPQDAQAPPTRPIHKSSLAGPHVHHTPQVLKAQSQPVEAREGNSATGEAGGGCAHHQSMPRHATMAPNILGKLSSVMVKTKQNKTKNKSSLSSRLKQKTKGKTAGGLSWGDLPPPTQPGCPLPISVALDSLHFWIRWPGTGVYTGVWGLVNSLLSGVLPPPPRSLTPAPLRDVAGRGRC